MSGFKRFWFISIFSGLLICSLCAQKSKNVVKVACPDAADFITVNTDGTVEGYGATLLKGIAQETGWEYEYIQCDWEDCLSGLKNGRFDIVGLLQRTSEREREFIFSTRNVGNQNTIIYTREDNDNLFYGDIEQLNNLTVGILSSNFAETLFDSFVTQNNLTVNKKYYASEAALNQALLTKETDFNVHSFINTNIDFKLIRDLGSDPFFFAMQRGNHDKMELLDDTLSSLLRENPNFLTDLKTQCFGNAHYNKPLFTRTEAQYIKDSPVLRVMINSNSYPFEYIDSDGNFCGVYADFWKRLSELTGFHFVYMPALTISDILEASQVKKIDLIARTPKSKIMTDKYNVNFTNPYTTETAEIIGLASPDSNTNQSNEKPTAILPLEDASYLGYLREKFTNWNITAEGNISSALKKVSLGEINIACCNVAFLQGMYSLADYPNLSIYTGLSEHIPISIGVVDEYDTTLLSILNKAIALIPEEEIEMYRTNNTVYASYRVDLPTLIKRNSLGFILAIVILFTLFYLILRHKEKRYKRWAYIDSLTDIPNNRGFEKSAQKALDRNKNTTFALYTIDIKKFKFINQSYGTGAGDSVLQQMAQNLSMLSDKQLYVGRSFADSFNLMLEVAEETEAVFFANKIASFKFDIIGASTTDFNLSVKLGIIMIFPEDHQDKTPLDIKTLIGKANIARHTIKDSLSHTCAFYDGAMDRLTTVENQIESKMEHALENNEFLVYFQPKYNLKTENLSGAEALVRWKDPEKGMIPPDFFIPIFERNGFVIELDFYVYEQVFSFMRKWLDAGKKLVTISMNMSRVHVGTPNFVQRFIDTAKKYNIDPSLIEIEVTESIFGENDITVKKLVFNLKEKGFRISMDDFGAGYSSLNLLKEVPVDVLKIDRNFLAEAANSEKTSIIIEQVVEMARKIDIETICEGVENRSQADFLNSIGCNAAQGFLFARPMPPEEFSKLLETK